MGLRPGRMENLVGMKNHFKGVFGNRRILITGDTGFKGSWLSIWLKELGAKVYGYDLPAKTQMDNFVLNGVSQKIFHQEGDEVEFDYFLAFAGEADPASVFHLAAQQLVIDNYE